MTKISQGRSQGTIDALLLDIVMPEHSGIDVLTHIRAACPNMPALFLSGYSESAIHADQLLHEQVEIIQKPYTPNVLLHAVRKMLDAKGE